MDKIMIAAEGRTVLQEDGQLWPSEGKVPEDTHYNRRRIADGDLVKKPGEPEAEVPAVVLDPLADVEPRNKPKGK